MPRSVESRVIIEFGYVGVCRITPLVHEDLLCHRRFRTERIKPGLVHHRTRFGSQAFFQTLTQVFKRGSLLNRWVIHNGSYSHWQKWSS